MTLQEFYQIADGDYETALENTLTPEYMLKFLKMFLEDPNYDKLVQALADDRQEDAFWAVHTLKGVCANLSFGRLYEAAVAVTEDLRDGKNPAGAREKMRELTAAYEQVTEAIMQL